MRGGIDAVREVADRNMDLEAEALYARLEHHVGRLSATSDEDEFLGAVVVYHLLAEGVIARTAQNLAATQYERLSCPGLAEGQRLVARDEARHIGIGVSYVRRRMDQAPERTSVARACSRSSSSCGRTCWDPLIPSWATSSDRATGSIRSTPTRKP